MEHEILGNDSLKNNEVVESVGLHSNGSDEKSFVTEESLVLIDLENTDKDKVIENHQVMEDGVSFSQLDKDGILKRFQQMMDESKIQLLMTQMDSIKESYRKFQETPKTESTAVETEETEEKRIEKPVEDNRFKLLLSQFKIKKDEFIHSQRADKVQNLEIKQALIEDLKKLNVEEEVIGKAFQRFREIQDKWKSTGRVPEDNYKIIQGEYHYQIELFYYNMKINKELKELDLQKNLIHKIEIIHHIQNLHKEESIKQCDFFLRRYLDEWSNIGPVPREKKDEIGNSFHEATRTVIQKIRNFYTKIHEEQKQNLELKTAVCLQAEQLGLVEYDSSKAWQDATDQLMKLREEWKSTGYAPKSNNQKIWLRFNKAINEFFEKKRQHYGKVKEQFKSNKALKTAMLEKAEALAVSTDWNTTTEEIKKLQQEWKTTGSAGKDEFRLWKKFRESCDKFFEAKKQRFASLGQEQQVNLENKKQLIQRLSEYSPNGEREGALSILKEFSNEWENIGHVPFKEKDVVYKEYKSVLDTKYKALKLNESERSEMMFRSKVEKLKESGDANKVLYKESRFIKEQIDNLINTITTYENNLGFFGKTNGKKENPMKAEVEKKIESTKKEVDVLQQKLRMLKSV